MASETGQLRPGLRVYAVGDVHGQAALLTQLAALVAEDLIAAPPAHALTVFLGDYIDRGPNSAGVLERLIRRDFPTDIVTLRGNHEQMLLDGLRDPNDLDLWLGNGGDATARSYGFDPDDRSLGTPKDLRAALLRHLPDAHRTFLDATRFAMPLDGYFFCHAGIMPGVPLDQQSPDTLMWIRTPFHRSTADHGKVVVHGHTPVEAPESLANRINVDTGAFRSGVLTCVALEGATRRFLSVR